MAPKYILHYLDIKGRGEGIRYILHYKHVEFTDNRITDNDWPAWKSQMPSGQVPVLEVQGKKVSQSVTIARYLGHELGLCAPNSWDNAKLDEAAHCVDDITRDITRWRAENDAKVKEELRKELVENILPTKYNILARVINVSDTHPYILPGDKPTWADFFVAATAERSDTVALNGRLSSVNKSLADYVERVKNLDGVREYVAKRTPTER